MLKNERIQSLKAHQQLSARPVHPGRELSVQLRSKLTPHAVAVTLTANELREIIEALEST